MAGGRLGNVLHSIRKLVAAGGEPLPDQELLGRFVRDRDEAAFTALVRRHGPMVAGVCRRILGRAPEAEDAWQATFLVLARRAALIRGSAGGWLHAVAWRVARRLRAQRARRPEVPLGEVDVARPDTTAEATWREVRQALDEELGRLPERYRAPLVLCYLEGMTQDEAARQLGWAPGVLRGRLDRGRERLRGRLKRRGLGLSAALLGTALGESASAGAVPAALVVATVEAALLIAAGCPAAVPAGAAAFAQEVTGAMMRMKWRTVVLTLAALAVVSVAGGIGYRALAAPGADPEARQPRPAAAPEKPKPADNPDAPRVVRVLEEVGDLVEPEDTLEVPVGQTRLVVFTEVPKSLVFSGGDQVGGYSVISPTQFVVAGTRAGTATWYVWFEDIAKAERGQILALHVRVLEPGREPSADKPARSRAFGRYVRAVIAPQQTFTLKAGEDRLILLKQAPKKIQLGEEKIAETNLLGDRHLLLTGVKPGTTVLTVWFPGEDRKAGEKVFSALVRVVD
jgi:RNA polymerase sigma factor (sigma-70 family)